MEQFEVPFSELAPDKAEIYRTMGSARYRPDEAMQHNMEEVLTAISACCRPRFGYRILPVEEVSEESLRIGGVRFSTGNVITPCFTAAEQVAVFVATAGDAFDAWLHERQASGDLMRQFIGDAVGSEIAEATARLLSDRIEALAAAQGMAISRSYSPGYCGWDVSEQRLLFSLLPSEPCGIRLNDSCLMHPVKSVSGLIALGSQVRKMPYGCAICTKRDCYKKRPARR